jgi:hypothetical protein
MFGYPPECEVTQLQRSFAEAIFHDDAPIPATIRAGTGPTSASRFGVYRNNVIAGLINAVAARYPVVKKLLWDDTFNRVARCYVMAEPPRTPVMLEYGDGFPQFLRQIGQGTAVDYIADIAELEAARTRAYHAPDERPVGKDAFARLAAAQVADLRLRLHPSVVLLKSRFPVVSIWGSNFYANDNTISEWKQESALIARPDLHVEVHRLPPDAYEFFYELALGQTLGSAAAHALARVPDFDLKECFSTLISANIVVAFERCESP